MSRLEVGASLSIKTFQNFSNKYKEIIKEKDLSFYKNKFKDRNDEMGNFIYVINKYTGNDYKKLNNYLREGKIQGFTEKELKSWTFCLHSSLSFLSTNVKEGTVVYRGLSNSVPSDWKVGKQFYFGEFVSTSLSLDVAKSFANGGPILIITIKNNGVKGRNNYCRSVDDISQYKGEKEVLITAFCIFKITKIVGKNYYLDCLGY